MFRSKTLFVLGAGSSQEIGLPIGDQLKIEIAEKLNFYFKDGYNPSSGDFEIFNSIKEHSRRKGLGYINLDPYLQSAFKLVKALPQAISIDNLLDAHKADELAQLCGKLGIVKSILESEKISKLYSSSYEKFDFSSTRKTWFAGFVKILTENVALDQVDSIFSNVAFINFNYDRCIEHYLYMALQNYYRIEPGSVASLMKTLNIVHPYGNVGMLPWQVENAHQGVHYGQDKGNILEIGKRIKTFNEQLDDPELLESMKNLFSEAEIIVFLGFAFHRQNLTLIEPNVECHSKRIYATAIGISQSDCEIIKEEVRDLLKQSDSKARIEINHKVTCTELFNEYWRGLTGKV